MVLCTLLQLLIILTATLNTDAQFGFRPRVFIPTYALPTNWSTCKYWYYFMDCSGRGRSDVPLLNSSLHITTLYMYDNGMTTLPTFPGWVKANLTDLDLSLNKLQTIGTTLEEFVSLRNLNISYNQLTTVSKFPMSISTLNLQNNMISKLTNVFGGQILTRVSHLWLGTNKISSLNAIDWTKVLPNLKHLEIENNTFANLDGLGSTSLRSLHIGHNGLDLTNLTSIRHVSMLQVSGMCFKKPFSFKDAVSVVDFTLKDISGLETVNLPPNATGIFLKNVPQAKGFEKLPPTLDVLSITKCKSFVMKYDTVQWNTSQSSRSFLSFSEVDVTKIFPNVTSLISTTEIPLKHLRQFNLHFTNITGIKDYGFQNLVNAQSIRLSHNRIRHIQSLAFYIPNSTLSTLDLSYNEIETVEPFLYVKATLTSLKLNGNRIKLLHRGTIPRPTKLAYIDISSNNFTNVEILGNFAFFTWTETVASNNPWNCIRGFWVVSFNLFPIVCDKSFKRSNQSCVCQRYINRASKNNTKEYIGQTMECPKVAATNTTAKVEINNNLVQNVMITLAASILAILLAVLLACVVQNKRVYAKSKLSSTSPEDSKKQTVEKHQLKEETKGNTPQQNILESRVHGDIPFVLKIGGNSQVSEYEGGYIVKPARQAIPEKGSESISYRNSFISQHKDVAVEYPANVYEEIPTSSVHHEKNPVSIPEVDYTSHHEYSTVNLQLCSVLAPHAYVNTLCCDESSYNNEEQNS